MINADGRNKEQPHDELARLRARIAQLEQLEAQRQGMEAALRESEERWQFALEGSGDGVWDWNVQTDDVYFSRRWKEMLGFADHELESRLEEWASRVHPDDLGWVTEEIQKHFRGETPIYVSEHRVKCKDGTYKWILDRGRVITWTGDGKPLRMVGTHTDVTERKASEEARAQAEEALLQERANFSMFFDTVDDFLFVLDEKGTIITVNDTVPTRLGYRQEELIGKSVLVVHPPDRPEEMEKIIRDMLEGRERHSPIPLITKNGNLIPVETRVVWGRWNDRDALFGVSKDISDLKLSEEKFSRIFNGSAAVMSLSTMDEGRFFDVNEAFVAALGYSREEAIGRTSAELGIFVDPAQRHAIVREVMEKGKVRNVEVTLRTKEGKPFLGSFSAEPLHLQEGLYLLTTMTDITERKRFEDSLNQHLLFLQTLIDTIPNPVFWKDRDGRYLGSNKSFEAYYGVTRENLIGKTVYDLRPTKEADEHHKADAEILLKGGAVAYDCLFSHLDGTVHDMINSKAVFEGPDGAVGGIVGVLVDTTERRQAEMRLMESEERYRTVIEHSNDGVAMIKGNQWVYVNQRLADELGYAKPEEVMEKTILDCLAPECRGPVAEIMRRRQKGEDVPSRYEITALRRDGTTVDVEVAATMITYKGEPVSLGFLRNITDRKRADQERMEARMLRGALDMAGTICHELNQPIQIVSGYVDLLSMASPEDAELHRKLDIMKEQTQRMGAITRKLMSLKGYTTLDYAGIGRIIDIDKVPLEEGQQT